MSSASSSFFDLVSHWRIEAPVECVWAALTDAPSWPRWWPYVKRVQTLRTGDAAGIGAVRRIEWRTRLPYALVIEVEVTESVTPRRLVGRSRGQLDGEGLWRLRANSGGTDVTYRWRVHCTTRWMRMAAPLLAPVFRWNHAGVMGAGERGLRQYVAAGRPAVRDAALPTA